MSLTCTLLYLAQLLVLVTLDLHLFSERSRFPISFFSRRTHPSRDTALALNCSMAMAGGCFSQTRSGYAWEI